MTPEAFRALALAISGAQEREHQGHPDFRLHDKIFASMQPEKGLATFKLSTQEQANVLQTEPECFVAAAGAWGRRGWTSARLAIARPPTIKACLEAAAAGVLPKRPAPRKKR